MRDILDHFLTRPELYSGGKGLICATAFLNGYFYGISQAGNADEATANELEDLRLHFSQMLGLPMDNALTLSQLIMRAACGDDLKAFEMFGDEYRRLLGERA